MTRNCFVHVAEDEKSTYTVVAPILKCDKVTLTLHQQIGNEYWSENGAENSGLFTRCFFFFLSFFTADDRSPVHSLHIPSHAADYTYPKQGETLKLRSEDQHNYTVLDVLGKGGCGRVYSAVRSDGLKVQQCF